MTRCTWIIVNAISGLDCQVNAVAIHRTGTGIEQKRACLNGYASLCMNMNESHSTDRKKARICIDSRLRQSLSPDIKFKEVD